MPLRSGEYQRLDEVQGDLFDVLCQASRMGRGEAVLDIGRKFIAARDAICGVGPGKLWGRALVYSVR